MAGPPTPLFFQVSTRYGGPGLDYPAVVTQGFAGEWVIPAGLDLLDAIDDLLKALITDDTQILNHSVKVGPVETGPTYEYSRSVSGTVGGNPNAANTCLLIQKSIADLSGRLAGRFFSPQPPQAWTTPDGVVAALGAATEACDAFFDYLETTNFSPVVFSSTGGDPRPVVGYRPSGRMATQRRRMRR